ncbi:LysM peptidoglycan-binding domain-containing protein [Neobacillus sp. SM06]|uniref:C40 family peptidase n=1 Tax=Neobacillus sp. SM06 TaxID=3422492 RepID=UPI003D2D82CA
MKKKVVTALATAAIASAAYAGTASADTYTVQKGDTLSQIAKKYQTNVPDLKNLNGLPSDLIFINQVLQVSVPASQPAPVAQAPAPTAIYTVVSGDTLSKIAQQFGISLSDLKQWNGINGYLIFPGQKLKVSDSGSAASAVSAPASQPPAAPAPVQSTAEYVVVSGDTLGKIARQFGIALSDLKQWNDLDSDLIFPGQKLNVSGSGSTAAPAPVPVRAPAPLPVPVSAPAPAPTKPSASADYTVTSGDTLGKIAALSGMSVSELMKRNNLTSSLIFPGQTLKVSGEMAASTPVAAPQASSSVLDVAKSVMGVPYVWGGSTLSGFDCSGFIYYVFNKSGKSIGRYSAAGYFDRSYYVDKPQPGDLVYFANTYKKGISHMGIYLGGGQFIHADEKRGISISNLDNPYYKAHFDSFKRFY